MIEDNLRKLELGESISDIEKQVFDEIRSVCKEFTPEVIARVAGGWVRDQLLGVLSNDVDICIEGTTCQNFAEQLKIRFPDSSSIAIIPAKPEQKKFVETARIRLMKNFEIDICSLRPDPTLQGKLPAEIDALRRDLTINAIFYNINNSKVEDFTTGIPDLKAKRISLPLGVKENFGDDPCRILRAFRFASYLNFTIDQSIFQIPPDIYEAFSRDISRERIETELLKMLNGPNPIQCIKWILEINLFLPIFDHHNQWNLNPELCLKRCSIAYERNPRFEVILAAIYYDLSGQVADPIKPKKKILAIECAVSRNLVMPMNVAERMGRIVNAAHDLPQINRVNVGRWLRKVGEDWNLVRSLLFDDASLSYFDNEIVPFIDQAKLNGVWNMKQLLGGLEVAKLYGVKPGAILSTLVEKQIDWQLEHPDGTVDEYKQWVLAQK